MKFPLALILFMIQCLMIILSFLFSLKLLKKNVLNYMKPFFLYTLLSVIVMIPMFILMLKNFKIVDTAFSFSIANTINNYSLIFNFLFLSIILIRLSPSKKSKSYLWVILLLFSSLMLYQIFVNSIEEPVYSAFAVNHFGLIFFSLIFLIKLFLFLPETNIAIFPMFWVVLGILFCSVINFPLFYLLNYLTNTNHNSSETFWVTNLRPIGYSIFYFMLTIAFNLSSK